MSEIKNIGSYLEIDSDGYIVNPASIDKIQEKWLKPLEEVKADYLLHFGSHLHSLYVRGSVPKGHAIDYVSDIDTLAFVDLAEEGIDISWSKETNEKIKEKYPFVQGVEIIAIPTEELAENKGDQIMIKTQSALLYGDDLSKKIQPFKPGWETAQHIKRIGKEIENTIEWLQEKHEAERIERKCTWIMKRLLRSGFELVMERSGKYSRDLYPCYETFSEFYPEKKDEMYKVLELAISPTSDEQMILEVLSGIGKWVAEEAGHCLQGHGIA